MLIYHFGTRDALLRAVLGHARQRQLDTFSDLLRARPDEPYTATLSRAWTSITGPDGQPYLRMFGQLRESAEQQLWPNFRRTATTDWLGPLEEGLRSIGRPDLATLVLAVIRGLLMDLDATGDTARTDQAFRHFLGAVEHLPPATAPRTAPRPVPTRCLTRSAGFHNRCTHIAAPRAAGASASGRVRQGKRAAVCPSGVEMFQHWTPEPS
ncbi:TetR/AcrR family transcriptional regulator [Streptomyces kaempferi]